MAWNLSLVTALRGKTPNRENQAKILDTRIAKFYSFSIEGALFSLNVAQPQATLELILSQIIFISTLKSCLLKIMYPFKYG